MGILCSFVEFVSLLSANFRESVMKRLRYVLNVYIVNGWVL